MNGTRRLYIVTGAAGLLGSALMRELSDRGLEAIGLLHSVKTVKHEVPGLSYFEGDVCDLESLRPLFLGAGDRELIVIHAAAVIPLSMRVQPAAYEVNVNGTKNILRLCREYNVKRLVYVSSVHAIPALPKGEQICEVSSFSPALVTGGYAKTKAEAAQTVADAAAGEDGLDAVTVFPSGIIGPDDSGTSYVSRMMKSHMKGRIPACVTGGFDFVDVRDVAKGCLDAAERGRKGEGYILSGAYCTVERLMALVSRECGRRAIVALPIWLASAAVPFFVLYAKLRGIKPLYTSYTVYTLTCNSSFSHEKAGRELGYTPRDIEQTVKDMVKQQIAG